MDETVVRNLLAALETIYNVASTNEARQQAQEYCEALKQNPSGPLYGYYLAHKDNQQPDVVRHFGLGLIEGAVRYRWSDGTLTTDIKTQIRLNVMSLAAEGTLPILTEQSFIKEKVARLFVEVAKREWPGSWDDMDVFLRQLFFKDETRREISLLILRSVCEDVCVYDDAVASLRKKDLRAGLLVIMASESVLKKHYPDGVKGHKDEVTLMIGETGNDGWISRLSVLLQELVQRCQSPAIAPVDEKIAVAVLGTLASALDWVLVDAISATLVIPSICLALLSSSEKIRLAAADCYDVLACRNLSEAERDKIIWSLLDDGGIELISKAYMAYATQILQGDAYKFLQKMVQATVNLGEQQVCAKRNSYVPKDLQKLLQLLYAMASHPSVLISSTVALFWTTILGHETFSKHSTVHSFVPPLLELYSGHLAKDFENRRKADTVYCHFASLDFESVTEFRVAAGHTFQRAVNVIHCGVPVVPLNAFLWVANKVTEALKIDFPEDGNVKDSVQFQSFDGTITLMEVTISSLASIINDKQHPESEQVLNNMNSLLGMLVEYDGKSVIECHRKNRNLHSDTFSQLLKAVEFPFTSRNTQGIRDLRRRAATTLVKIGRAIPSTLFHIYGEIETAVQSLIQRGAISISEKKVLLSFLLVIGFHSNNTQEQGAIFEKVVVPVAVELQSTELQEVLSDPKKFMAFIGTVEVSEALTKGSRSQELEGLLDNITQRRAKLSWSIDALSTFMKESIDSKDKQHLELWTSCLGRILPNLLSTIRCLNAIVDETLWADLHPELTSVLSMSEAEKELIVVGRISNAATGTGPTSTVLKLVSYLRVWLSTLRENSYKLLAQISVLGPAFYSIPSLQTILEQSLFEHVDNISNRQLRFLIRSAVQPIVLNCPIEYMSSVLSHLLMVLFPYLDQRLQRDWKLASDEGLVMDEMDDLQDLDVSDEIVKEVMLRDLTHSVADFLFSILGFSKLKPIIEPGHGTGTSTGHKNITQLALFILSSDTIAQSVISLVCHILTFKDTRACMRSVDTALCILTALVQHYPGTKAIISLFATVVLQAAMKALHDPYHQEGHQKLIQLITEVYVEVRAFDGTPKVTFQQALGPGVDRLEAFERELVAAESQTKKRALVRNFLQGIIGVAKSEWFKQKEQGDKPVSSRTIAGKYERPSQSVLDSEHHEDIGDGLASLFDE
ncbi:hypothetical protein BG011_000813 [Mortierella polycephala]|uniref:Importin N-terminal domain-containing protein n=1 Tax=Mortierella polycephala TaxID=41804 RepID=A0A9P6Q9R8_9FUNG|nr:hypothetical protein BG011_000813 [Mortierella polycephala]